MKSLFARRAVSACAISVAMSAALLAPGMASAAKVSKEACTGVSIGGQGSSLQKGAQVNFWTKGFNESSNEFACSGTQGPAPHGKPTVTYTSTGSGAGLNSWGIESAATPNFGPTNAFVGTDEPPNQGQIEELEGEESTPTAGSVETIPVVQESVAVIVHLPAGCTASSTVTGATTRLVLNDTTLEGIFAGTIKTWGAITDGGDKVEGTGCSTDPIVPVVREDQSGTTHIFKRFLDLISSSKLVTAKGEETWGELSEGSLNTTWPTAAEVQRGAASGGGEEIAKVKATEGAIGYVNLFEARAKGFGTPSATTFWVEIQNSEKGKAPKIKYTYADPSDNGEVATESNANCEKTKYTNGAGTTFPPESVYVPWNEVTTEKKEKNYTLCGLTYDLSFTHFKLVSGTSEAEAQTVENYLSYLVNKEGGQALIKGHDYLGLPKGKVAKEAETGAEAIAW